MYAIVQHTDSPVTLASIKIQWATLPKSLTLPSKRRLKSPVYHTDIGLEYEEFRFVELVWVDRISPSPYHTEDETVVVLTFDTLTVTKTWIAPTQQELDDALAAQRQANIDKYLAAASTSILLATINLKNPGMTPAQFRTFVEKEWPV